MDKRGFLRNLIWLHLKFFYFQQLEEIVLSGNMISYVEAEAFAGLPNLKDVNMGNNQLMEIDERAFWRGKYDTLTFSVDGNPWYCNEDLKVNIFKRLKQYLGNCINSRFKKTIIYIHLKSN